MVMAIKKSRFTIPLLIVYLLVGVFGETALVWCEESDSVSHLKFSYTGNCESFVSLYSTPYKQMMPVTHGANTYMADESKNTCTDSPVSLGEVARYSSSTGCDDASSVFTATIAPSCLVISPRNIPAASERAPLTDFQSMKILSSVVLLN